MSLNKGLSILFIFSNNHLLILLIYSIFILYFIYFYSDLYDLFSSTNFGLCLFFFFWFF